jgi:hypothetical protein
MHLCYPVTPGNFFSGFLADKNKLNNLSYLQLDLLEIGEHFAVLG